jgi:DNA-binding transcriptional MerR regulator
VTTLVSIGDFSRMTLLSVKALRHYHELGLLRPADIDPDSGYRRYRLEQVPTAQVIRRLRELDMSLDDVRAVIEAPDVGARNAAISAHLRRMEGELEQTRATVGSLRLLLDGQQPGAIPVTYRVSGPTETLAIRDRIPYAEVFDWLEVAFTELRAALGARGGARAGADAALYSSELLEDELGEIVAVIPVGAAFPGVGAGRAPAAPAGRVCDRRPRRAGRRHRPHLRGAGRRRRRAGHRRPGTDPRGVRRQRVRHSGRGPAPHRDRLARVPDHDRDLTTGP